MQRHRTYGLRDDSPLPAAGDLAFVGMDARAPSLVPNGFVSAALNMRLIEGVYETRRGLFSPAWTRHAAPDYPYRASYLRDDDADFLANYSTTYGAGVFSDPAQEGATWIVRVCARALVLTKETEIGRIIPFAPGLSVSAVCQVVQNFNQILIVRGDDETCLVWDSWSRTDPVRENVPTITPSGSSAIGAGHYALGWRERTVLLSATDDLIFSHLGDSTLYEDVNLFYVNRGRGDRLRSAAPLGAASLLVLKSQSAHVFTATAADLSDARLDPVPIDLQFDSPKTTLVADGRVWWLDRRGVRAAQLAGIDADNKVIVNVEVMSDAIAPLLRRIAWRYVADFRGAVTDERLYFAVALDDQTTPQTLLVWNRIYRQWESYDQWADPAFSVRDFAPAVPWLSHPRLFAVDSSGRQACLEYMLGEDCVAWSGAAPTRHAITYELISRGYTGGSNDPKKFLRAQFQLDTWNPAVAIGVAFDGPGETAAFSPIARSRTAYFTGVPAFDGTNASGRFHDPRRQDYSVALSNLYLQAGVRLEDFQTAVERRSIDRIAAWCQCTLRGTQGAVRLRSVSLEINPGPRSDDPQS